MRARAAGRFPPVNVFLDDDAVLIDLELPGKTAKDVDLSLEPQAVNIADKPAAALGEDGKPAEKQTPPAWSRRLELPFRINTGKANAKYPKTLTAKLENGVLTVVIRKRAESQPREIEIQ